MYTTKETAFIFYIFAKYASLTRHRNAEHLTSPVQRKRTIHSTAQKLQTAGAVPSKEKFGKITVYIYRCPGGNVPDFGRMFLMLKYTDLTPNTYIRS